MNTLLYILVEGHLDSHQIYMDLVESIWSSINNKRVYLKRVWESVPLTSTRYIFIAHSTFHYQFAKCLLMVWCYFQSSGCIWHESKKIRDTLWWCDRWSSRPNVYLYPRPYCVGWLIQTDFIRAPKEKNLAKKKKLVQKFEDYNTY